MTRVRPQTSLLTPTGPCSRIADARRYAQQLPDAALGGLDAGISKHMALAPYNHGQVAAASGSSASPERQVIGDATNKALFQFIVVRRSSGFATHTRLVYETRSTRATSSPPKSQSAMQTRARQAAGTASASIVVCPWRTGGRAVEVFDLSRPAW